MGISVKDILKISGMVMATGLTGGAAAGIAPIVRAAAGVLPGGDDEDDDEERKWKVGRIQEWMAITRRLMDQPMRNEVRANTLKNKLRSDFFQHYGDAPKDRWVDKLHSDIVMAVKGDMAVGG